MEKFEMVAKTLQGLEEVLAEELRSIGAIDVEPGLRAVTFLGTQETMYKANFCTRTAIRILKPFLKFYANSPEELYERAKEFEWSSLISLDKSFAIDTVSYSEDFNNSLYATYKIKDAICDWFSDRFGGKRPRVSLTEPDIIINLHIAGNRVTLSLDSSGEPLYKRGWRVAQTEAPLNEVLAAGIILRSGWRGEVPFIDPMCGSGTFLIEAAMIAANIYPGIFRQHFAFEKWRDFDAELFENIFNDDSAEKEIMVPIIGADISPKAIAIAEKNIKSARFKHKIEVKIKSIADWEEAPTGGVLITNPPYGERLNPAHLDNIYATLGRKLKHIFTGYHAWILGYKDEFFAKIGLAPSQKIPVLNGKLECKLQEYIIFEGTKKDFRQEGGRLKDHVQSYTPHSIRRFQPSKTSNKRPKNDYIRFEGGSYEKGRTGENLRKNKETPGNRIKRAFEQAAEKKNGHSSTSYRKRIPKSEYPFKK